MDSKPKAFIFDLNGTMIDDMAFHNSAWSQLLNGPLGLNLGPEEVKAQMYGKNEELLVRLFGEGHFSQEEMSRLSIQKEHIYQTSFLPHMKLINGLDSFLHKTQYAGIKMAIGSAAIPFNVDFILDNLSIRPYFDAIVTAADVKISKPDPETFLKAADQLEIAYKECVVFEDSPKGVKSASLAGMPCVALTTMHTREDFSKYPNVLFIIDDYTDPALNALF